MRVTPLIFVLAMCSACEKKEALPVQALPPPPAVFMVPVAPAVMAERMNAGIDRCIAGQTNQKAFQRTSDITGKLYLSIMVVPQVVPTMISLAATNQGTLVDLSMADWRSHELINRLKAWAVGNFVCQASHAPS